MLYNIKSKIRKVTALKKGYKVTKLGLDNQRCNLCNLCNLHFAEIGEKQNEIFYRTNIFLGYKGYNYIFYCLIYYISIYYL